MSDVINLPTTSPAAYSIAGLTSDGASHTVTVVFSDDAGCISTVDYTAPANCIPGCSLNSPTSYSCAMIIMVRQTTLVTTISSLQLM
ncbi:MAG: hypothetical protein R2766_02615 [Saprospiraceae bacterium]